jgi:hypothetical protein
MQAEYPERFERDVGCNEAEWLAWMPRAIGAHPWRRDGSRIVVEIASGALTIAWSPLPERRIALLRMQRLLVGFAFERLDAGQRKAFMKPFDLSIQRGGG